MILPPASAMINS